MENKSDNSRKKTTLSQLLNPAHRKIIYYTRLMTSGFLDNSLHLLNLSEGSLVSTQSLLGELLSSLLTSVSDKFDDSSLVWGKTGNLTDNLSDKRGSLGEGTFTVGDLWSNGSLGNLVTFVCSNSDT